MRLQNLYRYIDWYEALNLVGMAPPNHVFPHTMTCPFGDCYGQLTVYNDIPVAGQWWYCQKCKLSGDSFNFFCKLWDVDLPTCMQKLTVAGLNVPTEKLLPTDLNKYERFCLYKRIELANMVRSSSNILAATQNKSIRAVKHALGYDIELTYDRWLAGPGQFIGSCEKQALDTMFGMSRLGRYSRPRPGDPRERNLEDYAWTDVLMLPMWDMPGRVKGVLAVGRDGKIPSDVLTYSHNLRNKIFNSDLGTWAEDDLDCGLTMWPALDADKTPFDGYAFVMSDPFLAMRIHCTHFRDNSDTLPLVSTYENGYLGTRTSIWDNLSQKFIFWGAPTIQLFKHAAAINGKVSTLHFLDTGPIAGFNDLTPKDVLKRVVETAQPWDSALDLVLSRVSHATAESLIFNIGLSTDKLLEFVKRAPEGLRDRLDFLIRKDMPRKTSYINSTHVIEKNSEWIDAQTGAIICSAVIRIDSVVNIPKTAHYFYVGRILHKGKEIPFDVRDDVFEDQTLKWLRRTAINAGTGLIIYDVRWEPYIISIAIQFHTPNIVVGANRVGWDADRFSFVFPQFELHQDGKITINPHLKAKRLPMWHTARRKLSCTYLKPPEAFTVEEVKELNSSRNTVNMAIAYNVCFNALALAIGVERKGVGLLGPGTIVAKRTAAAMGCTYRAAADMYHPYFNAVGPEDHLRMLCHEDNWPIILGKRDRSSWGVWAQTFTDEDFSNCFIFVYHPVLASVLVINGGWNIIHCYNEDTKTKADAVFSKIPSSFLKFAVDRKFQLPTSQTVYKYAGVERQVLTLFREWFISIGGRRGTIDALTDVMDLDDKAHTAANTAKHFGLLLAWLFDNGHIALNTEGMFMASNTRKAVDISSITYIRRSNLIVTKFMLNNLLPKLKIPQLNTYMLTKGLRESGALVDLIRTKGKSGWIITRAYFDKALEAFNLIPPYQEEYNQLK